MDTLFHRNNCRGCFETDLVKFLDLGLMPLAGGHLTKHQIPEEKRYQLSVHVCRSCSLVQILDVVPPDTIFSNYQYVSGAIQGLIDHFAKFIDYLSMNSFLPADGFLVEFGSNDGVLLSQLKAQNYRILGVDPSDVAERAKIEKGIPLINQYFTKEVAENIYQKYGPADVVTGSNVFAHTDDVHTIVEGALKLLKPNGVFVVEVHYLLDLLDLGQYDTIYHEHLQYYSVHALKQILVRHGLKIIDVVRLPMHGGAIRVVSVRNTSPHIVQNTVTSILELEQRRHITELKTYEDFGRQAKQHSKELKNLLSRLHKQGKTISGYGAAGRGTILLNFAGIGKELLDYVVDASPLRANKFMPGVHIPTVLPSYFHEHPTDYSLILAWNYSSYILKNEVDYATHGHRFIIPLPTISIIPDE